MSKIVIRKMADISQRNALCIISGGVFVALYLLSGTFHLGQAGYLPLSELERDIPMLDWTIWIYAATFPLIFKMVYEIQCEQAFNKAFYSFYILLALSIVVFIIYPVAYPREMYPLMPGQTLHYSMFWLIRSIDAPTNCFPSLHVSLSYLFSFFVFHESRSKGIFYFLFATAIAVSTLTTKQHYIVDVVAGFILAFGVYIVFYHFTEIKMENEESQSR